MDTVPPPDLRDALDERERALLSPHACRAAETRGREREEAPHAYRTEFQRDRDRILHSKAFRRLKQKTQVFLAPFGDHFRTRLTHTLEVAQIARTAARALRLNEDLVEAIALGHDLGHTPFGHAGEAVLNERHSRGFRHDRQSLRVVEVLEVRASGRGLNLCWEVRDGIRYHSEGKAMLFGRAAPGPNTLEGAVVAICDAIAYISHDIDDAIYAGALNEADLPQGALRALGDRTSARLDRMVGGLIAGSGEGEVAVAPDVLEPMLALRHFMYTEVYPKGVLAAEIEKAKGILRALYDYLLEHPVDEILHEGAPDADHEQRTVDFVAGMTDPYALELYERHLMPRPRRF